MKQYLIVRSDLNMRKGKIASQCCHASNAIIIDNIKQNKLKWIIRLLAYPIFRKWIFEGDLIKWLNGSFTKIVLGTHKTDESKKLFDRLYYLCQEYGYPCFLVEDMGLTEFHGVKNKTVLGIGPIDTKDTKYSQIIEILQTFKLL